MILMALVCTALTKPLVLLVDKFSSDKRDAYSFGDLHHNISPITTSLRRASRMVYGTELPVEWTLPAADAEVVSAECAGHSKSARSVDEAEVAASDAAVTTTPHADRATASRVAWFWSRLASSSIASITEARLGGAPDTDETSPPSLSDSGKGRKSLKFREISKVTGFRGCSLWYCRLNAVLSKQLFLHRCTDTSIATAPAELSIRSAHAPHVP